MKHFEPKNTTSMKVVRDREVLDQCSEPQCRITIRVEPEEKGKGNKCVSCMMREKLQTV